MPGTEADGTVTCGKCGNAVPLPLRQEHRETLDEMRSGPGSAADVAKALGIERSTAFQRLEKLRGLGFVTRRKDGKEWVYELTSDVTTNTETAA